MESRFSVKLNLSSMRVPGEGLVLRQSQEWRTQMQRGAGRGTEGSKEGDKTKRKNPTTPTTKTTTPKTTATRTTTTTATQTTTTTATTPTTTTTTKEDPPPHTWVTGVVVSFLLLLLLLLLIIVYLARRRCKRRGSEERSNVYEEIPDRVCFQTTNGGGASTAQGAALCMADLTDGSDRHDHTYDTVPHLPPEKKKAVAPLPNERLYSLVGNPYKDSSQVDVNTYCLLQKPKVTTND
ncbi:uncharacterized protein LOC117957209 [Etheostoma cragini]|uniref:uncharacterized protein LOC117957209 n=1 Tax=Etheostoma cragini TaxID=417921 RepID=UPI00155EC799|nr:uncharacterized protein LOC117957209 [Etheostoma cragini]